MITKKTTIINKTGLHARPASDFVTKAKEFSSDMTIQNLETKNPAVNAKSILMLMGEGISSGMHVEISAEGTDEQAAVDALVSIIESGFGESD